MYNILFEVISIRSVFGKQKLNNDDPVKASNLGNAKKTKENKEKSLFAKTAIGKVYKPNMVMLYITFEGLPKTEKLGLKKYTLKIDS